MGELRKNILDIQQTALTALAVEMEHLYNLVIKKKENDDDDVSDARKNFKLIFENLKDKKIQRQINFALPQMVKRNCDNLFDKKIVYNAEKEANIDSKRGIFLLQEYGDVDTREIDEHLPDNVDKANMKSLIAGSPSTMMSNRISVIGTDIRKFFEILLRAAGVDGGAANLGATLTNALFGDKIFNVNIIVEGFDAFILNCLRTNDEASFDKAVLEVINLLRNVQWRQTQLSKKDKKYKNIKNDLIEELDLKFEIKTKKPKNETK